jgi:demethylmenaquinone methyltransferase/2-methoxy-6-polyprenyl-1,4-benzoquinol methylase
VHWPATPIGHNAAGPYKRAGDSVVDIACGTGLNFPLIEEVIGPDGRIVGVDLTDAMLAQAQDRIEANGWSNISLVQADAAGFSFPAEVDAILSTYAMTQVPECAEVIAHGAAPSPEADAGSCWMSRFPTTPLGG